MSATAMAPNKNQQNADSAAHLKSKKLILALILAIVLVTAAAFYATRHKSVYRTASKSSSSNPLPVPTKSTSYSVSYSKLSTYSLQGGSPGTGATFVQPSEFQELGGKSTGEQVLLIDLPKARTVPDYGRIALVAVKADSASIPAQASGFANGISDSKNQSYTATLAPLTTFVNQRLPIKYQATISSNLTVFTNSNIAANAWIADFSAANPGSDWPTLQGRVIMIFGEQAEYYFMAENISSIWQSNQSVWQQVINSLKVDQ